MVDRTAIQEVHHLWIEFEVDEVSAVTRAARVQCESDCLQHGHFDHLWITWHLSGTVSGKESQLIASRAP
jgi:hypothetical protein